MAFNQPNLCSSPVWNPDAITLSDNDVVDRNIGTIVVSDANSLYALEPHIQQVRLWLEGSTVPMVAISGNFSNSQGLFVSPVGDVYIGSGKSNNRVEKWPANASSGWTVMNVSDRCFSLFLDLNGRLYCSLDALHQVVATSLSTNTTTPTIMAGTGTDRKSVV